MTLKMARQITDCHRLEVTEGTDYKGHRGHLSSKRVCPEDLSTLTVNSQLLTYGRFSMGYAGHRFKPRLEPLALQESKQNPETKLSYFQVPFIQKGFVALLQTELCPPKIHMMELQPLL